MNAIQSIIELDSIDGQISLKVRETIVAAGNESIFFSLLETEDHLIRAYAGVALAKIAVVGVDKHTDEEHERILGSVVGILTEEHADTPLEQDTDLDEHTKRFEVDYKERREDCVRTIIESLAYLSLNIITKKILTSKHDGKWLKAILAFGKSKDKSVRFGVVSIIHNLTVSSEDIGADYDKEVEELRKVASKGLPGAEEREKMTQKAGDPKVIKLLRVLVVKAGATSALLDAYRAYQQAYTEVLNLNEESSSARKQQTAAAVPDFIAKTFSRTLLHLATETENRGLMVQQGALRLLLELYNIGDDKIKEQAAVSLARIAISTNPNLYPQEGLVYSLVAPFLRIMKESTNELFHYEALLALCNIASLNEAVQAKIVTDGGWNDLTMLLSSENALVQCAAVECMANLCTSDKIIERLRSDAGQQDLKILLMFCGTEDVRTQTAATGAVAMISSDPETALRLANTSLTSTLAPESEEDEEGNREDERTYTRDGRQVLHDLITRPDLDPNVRVRVEAAIKYVAAAMQEEANENAGFSKLT
jgi:hypothetical protein